MFPTAAANSFGDFSTGIHVTGIYGTGTHEVLS